MLALWKIISTSPSHYSQLFFTSSSVFLSLPPLLFPIKLKIVNVPHLMRVDRLMDFSFTQSLLIKHLSMPGFMPGWLKEGI